jgi:hypothetical protein
MATSHSPEPPRSSKPPLSPFASPAQQPHGGADPEVKARIAAFNKEYAEQHSEPVQVPPHDPVWTLENILGASSVQTIQATGQLSFHVVGDTGFDSFPCNSSTGLPQWDKPNQSFETAQAALVARMTADTDPSHIERGPAFLLHLGDVNYFDNTRTGYAQQFYEPFSNYGRKIIAIPGNHDMEVKVSQQQFPCQEFLENFCNGPWVPPAAQDIDPPREMVGQPGLYWRLDAPFVQIIGLCSNVGEKEGVLRDQYAGPQQYEWFQNTLSEVAKQQQQMGPNRLALIVALHHPPYTSGYHQPSPQMCQDMDDAFKLAGVWPDAVFAAHDHLYERYTRTVTIGKASVQIPYIVAGGGARYYSQGGTRSAKVPAPIPGVQQNSVGNGNGYLVVTVSPTSIRFDYRAVDHLNQNASEVVELDLQTRKIQSS